MGLTRLHKALLAGSLLTLLLLALFHRNRSDISDHVRSTYDRVFQQAAVHPDAHAATYSDIAPFIDEFAHRIDNPDGFKAHFENVKRLPPISVAEAKKTCTWTDEDMQAMQFMWGDESEWMKHDFSFDETEMKRQEWIDFIDTQLIPWDSVKHNFHGRGIVTTGGNVNTMKRLRLTLNQLKRLGSKMPVEIHYWEDEISDAQKKQFNALYPYIFWNDLSDNRTNIFMTHAPGADYGHFNLKTAAAMNSRFAEILMLDTDCLPVTMPETLFETDTYKEYGTIFWPDIGRTRPQNPMWAITRTFCRMDEYEQESGQLLINKKRLWYHLHLASWMNEQPYYLKMLLGDKDMFRFAWYMLKTKFGRPQKWLTSLGVQHDDRYCGHSFAQMHPNGGVAFIHRGLYKLHHTESLNFFRIKGGIYNAFKQSKYDTDMTWPEPTKWSWDYVEGLKDRRGWSCMDMPDVEWKPIDKIIPNFEEMWEAIDGYWMIEDPDED